MERAEPSETLRELLAENRRYSDVYEGGLSNHASMALIALERLGAPEERLRAYWAHRSRSLELLDPHGNEVARRRAFADAIAADGAARVLRAELPRLIPGIGAHAFHGLLCTAYAVEIGDDADLAVGLAAWDRHYLDLGGSVVGSASIALADAYDVARVMLMGTEISGDLVFARMAMASRDPRFADVAAIGPQPGRFDELVRLTTAILANVPDFVALHAMTASVAIGTLRPYVDEDVAFTALWRATLAAYAAAGFPERPAAAREAALVAELPSVRQLTALAAASDDDHAIKLVDACTRTYAAGGDPLCIAAAVGWLRRVRVLNDR